eukprot:gnl/Ergobibamus_cyprinoides/3322.p2 GENE.gnl/Ergobibamus_cyprinoides/3322~~gnl/Ergobibamus_cyprinoides/3322.p2  ORF type:complete len:155 (+),score=60.72 gnl/Ergobibamus_cyprinoides/3322:22-465(+)
MSLFNYEGCLSSHGGWVTSVVSCADDATLVSGSRDNHLMIWNMTEQQTAGVPGVPVKCLEGHAHFVSSIAMSSDGAFALSGSWDHTLRLWEVATGRCIRTFKGHTKDVLAVAFSADNRHIISCGRDKTIRLWNTVGEVKKVTPTSPL